MTRFGSSDPSSFTWGDVHCTHLAANGPIETMGLGCRPTDGGDGTVNVSDGRFLGGGALAERHESSNGPLYRMVTTFADDGVPESTLAIATGNVEDPESPWYDNNLDDWVEGRYRPFAFRRADVEADAQEAFTLDP